MLKRSEIVLATICLALVGALALTNIRLQRATVEREFRVLAEESMIALDTRMQTYLQSLQGTLAYLRNTGNPSRSDFEAFVEDLRISTFLPGINGVGFIASIPRENSDAFVQMARRDGYENFEIHPDTTSKQRYVIQHIFPIAPNREAVGLDITFEKGRRETADAALVTGEARMTPRITLVQDAKKKAGFLLLLPYFKNISSVETQSQDINDFNGWVKSQLGFKKVFLTQLT